MQDHYLPGVSNHDENINNWSIILAGALMPRGVYVRTEEIRKKYSERQQSNKGVKSPMFGKHLSEATRKKLSQSLKGEKAFWFGKSLPEETRRKMSVVHKGKYSGDKNPGWKGGISFEPYCIKFNNEFKERVREFFNRRCVECGAPEEIGKRLCVHHVNFNKQTCCDHSIPLFVPLCAGCHNKTNHNRPYWEQHFTAVITEKYDGKCYLTKEEMNNRAQSLSGCGSIHPLESITLSMKEHNSTVP